MLKLANITKSYRNKRVLSNISLEIRQQRLISVIGPNGAGKSTLLSLITQLVTPDAGEIRLDQKDLTAYDRRTLAQKISLLRQSNHLNLRLTVRELVEFGRFPYTQGHLTADDRQQVTKSIAYLGLESLSGQYIDRLSGGERQRAFIAMVLAQDTDYILLDEPLNNLDMKHSVQIMKTLRRLVDELGKTVLLVIHDINFASCYSDEIAAIKNGCLVGYGKTADMIEPSMLKRIYDMDIEVNEVRAQRICNYFRP